MEGEDSNVSVLITEYGKQNIEQVLKHFDTNELSVVRQYSKNLLEHLPKAPPKIVTIIEITSSSKESTLDLVITALQKVNKLLPIAAKLYEPTLKNKTSLILF